MDELLGVQARYNEDGGTLLHQEICVDKLVARFLPDGVPSTSQRNTLPYSEDIRELVEQALAG